IIVVGHYGCGGIHAAMAPDKHDAIGSWLAPVRALYRPHQGDASPGSDEAAGLCKRNIVAQVEALAMNPLVHGAWSRRANLTLHGWVYAIGDGLLQTV